MAKLYFYYSAMNAGKTTKLLQNNFNYIERGMKTILYTFAGDDRYGVAKITSRIGLSADSNVFDSNTNIFEEINNKLNNDDKIACVLIDEAQFLNKKQVKDLCKIVDELNIPVLTYGLRTDFLGEPFEGSLYLLLWSDELIEVKTICHCGKKATMNAKFNGNGEMITLNNNQGELNNSDSTSVNDTSNTDGMNITNKNNNIKSHDNINKKRLIDSTSPVGQTSLTNKVSQIALVNQVNLPTSANEMSQVDIGGNEKYIALCRKHYFMGKLK